MVCASGLQGLEAAERREVGLSIDLSRISALLGKGGMYESGKILTAWTKRAERGRIRMCRGEQRA